MRNHEANAINVFSQFAMPGDEENWGLRYGALRLTALNDTPQNAADLLGLAPALV